MKRKRKRKSHRDLPKFADRRGNVLSRLEKHSQITLSINRLKKKAFNNSKYNLSKSLTYNDFKTAWKFGILFLTNKILKKIPSPWPVIKKEFLEKTLANINLLQVLYLCWTPF